MFGGPDDDDLEFNPAAGSKLASLFNLEKSPDKGNASLTYTAPKQPRNHHLNEESSPSSRRPTTAGNPSTSASNKLTLIVAKAVNSFKLEDGNYNHQGKLGLALLGNPISRLFQLLLYKGKQQQITTARISPHFQFTVQPNLYASFYDDRTQNWSIMFESKDDAVDFTTQLAVARYRAADPSAETLISQEILPGSGDCFREGETVQLQLSAQPFSTSSVQTVDIRQSVMKCTLSHKLTNAGWAAGLMGSSSGSQRLLLVPLSTSLPWLSSKRSDPLLVEATINREASTESKELPSILQSSVKSITKNSAPASGVDSAPDSSNEDSSVRARGASIREALTNSPRSNKASIISRMARMGQATLPLKGAVTCNPSDSEETEEDTASREGTKPPLKARPAKTRSASSSARQQTSPVVSSPLVTEGSSSSAVTVLQSHSPWNQHQQNVMGQVISLSSQHQLPMVGSQSSMMSPTDPTPHISMFLSESRIHNAEMRMHLSKFGDKVDQLMTKVDNLHPPSGAPVSMSMSGVGLEPNVLLSSIEKLVRDNQSLQAEVAEKNKRLEEQNERIFSLLNTNSKFLEQSSSLLEQQQKQEQQQQKQEQQQHQHEQQLQLLQQMREEKLSLGNQLVSLQNQLATVQELVQALQKSNTELNQELNLTRNQLQEKEKYIREVDSKISSSVAQDNLLQLQKALDEQKSVNLRLQQQIADSNDRFATLEKKHSVEISQVKEQVSQQQEDHFKKSMAALKEECSELNKKLQEQSDQPTSLPTSSSSLDNTITEVKLLMNNLYRGLNQQFSPGQSYEGGHIRTVIGTTVKRQALQFVDKLEKQLVVPMNDLAASNSVNDKIQTASSNSVAPEKADDKSQLGFLTASTREEPPLSDTPPQTSESTPIKITEGASKESGEQDTSLERSWRPLPPPPPLFHDEDDSDEWLT